MEDLGGRQDDHAEDDLEAGQECSRQAAPTCYHEVEQDLLGYRGVLRRLKINMELEKMTSRCHITISDLEECGMSSQDVRSAGTVPSVV